MFINLVKPTKKNEMKEHKITLTNQKEKEIKNNTM